MQTFVALVSALVGVIAAIQALSSKGAADEAADRAEKFKQAIERQASERAERETKGKLDTTAYEAVIKVLELDRSKISADVAKKRDIAVLALVSATASDQMKQPLFAVMGAGSISPEAKESAGAAADVLRDVGSLESNAADVSVLELHHPKPDSGISYPLSALQEYRVAIFYCQRSNSPELTEQARVAAEKLKEELQASPAAQPLKITWQTKLLPELLNSSPGYAIQSNQIRFNPADDEEKASRALKSLLESVPSMQASRVAFGLRTVTQRTPSYLSVFLCGLNSNPSTFF